MKKILLSSMLLIGSLFANSLSEIKDKGVLRVGVFTEQPPFGQLVDGTFTGFEVDFANAIAKNLFKDKGGKVEFVATRADQRLDFVEKNKVDLLLATFTITDDRSKKIDFSLPYFSVNIGVLSKKRRWY